MGALPKCLLTWYISACDDYSYPKGLIVAFTLKNTVAGGSAEQSVSQEPVNDDANACKADGGLNSSENTAKENEQKVSENVNADEESSGVDKEKGDKVDEENGSETKGIKTEGEEKSSEDPIEKDEKKEKPNPAVAYKDDMNVVLREDLKAVFEKFGTVKVIGWFPLLLLSWGFIPFLDAEL